MEARVLAEKGPYAIWGRPFFRKEKGRNKEKKGRMSLKVPECLDG